MIIEEHPIDISCNQQIFTRWCMPKSKLAGILLVVHGLGEHSGRYATHFSEFYTGHNFGVVAFDLPGHGKSSGKRGHIENPIWLLECIDRLIQMIEDRFPDLSIFLYGHSFGGEITLWYSLVRNPTVKGVILSAPLIGPKDSVPLPKLILAKTMDKIMPSFCMDNGLRTEKLSRDPDIVNRYRTDPLVHNQVSARTGMVIINRGKWISDHIQENRQKMLLMVGEMEAIVNPDAIHHLAQKEGKIEFKVWPGLCHELHNEPEKLDVMNYCMDWMMNGKCHS